MKKVFGLAILAMSIFIVSCKNNNELSISGKVENAGAIKKVLLYETDQLVDSAFLNENNEFKFRRVTEEPDFYTLLVGEKNFLLVNRNFFLQTVEKNKAYALANISFDQSKSELKPGFEAELEKVISILSENAQYNLLLEGHTDNQGDWNDNLKLSQERVENVKAYLVSKGVDAKRIQTKGWGGSKPLANNLLEDTRKNNRRVEFTLVPVE